MSSELILGVAGALIAAAGLAWAMYAWMRDRNTKAQDAAAAEARRREEARTRLEVRLRTSETTDWKRAPARPEQVGTRWVIPGRHLDVDVTNPTDRSVRLRRMAIVGTTTGNELDWAAHFYLPFEIEPRDGFHLGVNHGWLEEQFRGDNAVFLRVETWDGETIESEQHPLEAG